VNSRHNSALGSSPAELLLGFSPALEPQPRLIGPKVTVADVAVPRAAARAAAQRRVEEKNASAVQKWWDNRSRAAGTRGLRPGRWAWLTSAFAPGQHPTAKLPSGWPRWIGPVRVAEAGSSSVRLALHPKDLPGRNRWIHRTRLRAIPGARGTEPPCAQWGLRAGQLKKPPPPEAVRWMPPPSDSDDDAPAVIPPARDDQPTVE